MATAKHRAIDLIRRRASYERKLQEIGRDAALRPENAAATRDRAVVFRARADACLTSAPGPG